MNKQSQKGFEVISLFIVVAVLAVAVFAGSRVYTKVHTKKEVIAPTQIKAKSDVRQAIKSLDSSPLDGQLDPTKLDSDISALL